MVFMINKPRSAAKKPLVLIISGPSGVGKTQAENKLCQQFGCQTSVSLTTRKPRQGEIDGLDYHFVSRAKFLRRIKEGEFLEYEKVHDDYYGTPIGPVLDAIDNGEVLILNIDVQGHASVRAHPNINIVQCVKSVFLLPPSMHELRRRAFARGDNVDQATVERRLARAKDEAQHASEFDYQVIARSKKYTFERLSSIIEHHTR